MQMGKLNKLQSFRELQQNLSLQVIENMNSSVMIRKLSIILQNMATKLCHQLYKKDSEHKCKPCPKGWLWHEDSCYLQGQESNDWQTSEQECRNLNASLLKIKNKSVLDFIKSQTIDFWLGLSPSKNYENPKTLKEIISSSDWLINNTNGFSGEMYCGCRYYDQLVYKHCAERENFICEKLADRVKTENTLINEEPDGFL
ncbi:C-type lectin domain family 12 member A-like [Talpa occidentalis]|uniref:C-type lectin domain family 12 member A-like n=1 Tax=Talpa occidentalis TaxID=50954 RepID=UPI00189037FE|nr:C-type lectin domain family 12 member A-like [Talpa occidentalis]